jgi:hypothetical protein
MNPKDLNEDLQWIRKTFFPRWDRECRWRLIQVPDLNGGQGRCYSETCTVRILILPHRDARAVLLIHEICHAATNQGHGKKWLKRMEKAAATAEALGYNEIAALLREQIAAYGDPNNRITAADVYRQIEDVVWQDQSVTFHNAVDFVRRDYGLTRQEFLKRFRRARAVFGRERRDARESARMKAKWSKSE